SNCAPMSSRRTERVLELKSISRRPFMILMRSAPRRLRASKGCNEVPLACAGSMQHENDLSRFAPSLQQQCQKDTPACVSVALRSQERIAACALRKRLIDRERELIDVGRVRNRRDQC